MRVERTKLKFIIIGFLIIFIPIFFFCYELDNLYKSTKEELKLDLNEKLLSVSTKLKNDLDTYNYLYSEITKIHEFLFPNFKEEVTDKILDDSFAQNLYTKETFDKLINLTKEKFAPIFISFSTNNLENNYAYFSPKLENDIEEVLMNNPGKDSIYELEKKLVDEKRTLLNIKVNEDAQYLIEHFKRNFKSNRYENVIKKDLKDKDNLLFKYISRFKYYKYYTKTYYTDYFEKQLIYNVSKYSMSKKGIHGYYSLIIPQSQIDPDGIIESAIKKNSTDEVKIERVQEPKNIKDLTVDLMTETDDGFEYIVLFPTILKNHITAYKKADLHSSFKISINYPEKLKQLKIINLLANLLTISLVLTFIYYSIRIYNNKYRITINLSRKLILVLSAIILLPITGVGLLTYISSQKFTKVIDNNVSQNLSNEINNIVAINNENNQRQLSEIFELKKQIEKNYFFPEMKRIDDGIISQNDKETWYNTWSTHLVAISQDGNFYNFYPHGKKNNEEKIERTYGVYLPKYANNLNILNNNKIDFKDDITSSFTLGTLEKYININMEEQSAGQESIPHRNLIGFDETNIAVYFYAQDKKKQHNLLINAIRDNYLRYDYIGNLKIPNRQNWFETKNDYSNINLAIALSDHFYAERYSIYPFLVDSYKNVKDIIIKSILSKDSLSERAQMPDGNIEKKSVYFDNDYFMIGGTAKSNYNTLFSFGIYMIFPILLTYALLLMILLTGFISVFIKEPLEIYREAIDSLENKDYGITIESFSKDEFDSITTAFNEMSLAVKQKFMISRYVSAKLIQSVSQDNVQDIEEGKLEKVTILSSDIRNFTGISEQHEPSVIVEMLNSYFTKMQQAISNNGGIIDKYIGDAIQAVFYDEPDKENQVIRAAKAALAMRKALAELNKQREKEGLFQIQNGIGIDTDFAITGTIGTEKGRKDFSVNGDVVSRAAEFEAKTKLTQSKILISKVSIKELDCHVTDNVTISHPLVEALGSTHHQSPTTNHQSQLVYKDFDSESVELLDVR